MFVLMAVYCCADVNWIIAILFVEGKLHVINLKNNIGLIIIRMYSNCKTSPLEI